MIWAADPVLQAAAMGEIASRRKHLPGMKERQEIERGDADADLLAWRTIATMLGAGNVDEETGHVANPLLMVESEATWASLDLAASRAVASLSARADAAPADPYLAKRRDAAQAIVSRIAAHRAFWTRTPPAALDLAA